VQEAFPGSASRRSVSTAGHQNGPMALVQQAAPVMDLPPIDSSEFIEDGSIVDSFEAETEFSSQTLFESDYDLEPDLPEVERSDLRVHNVEAELDMSEDGSSQAQAGLSNHSLETEPVYTHSPQAGEGDVLQSPEQAVTFTEPVFEGLLDDHIDSPQPTEGAAVTDPWQDPLPPWDYSQNEWPVLMGPPKPKQFGVLRTSLVVLVLLAAGGFYFFILQPTLREQRTSAPVDSKAAERAAAVAQPVPEAKPAEPSPSPVASSPSSETPASAPAIVESKPSQLPEDGNTHGKFALQAAAFPNQAGADEFAEKLKKAGVPSYIVSADLGRRGRWFRVRVGRFNTADDAQKFAAEAQLRAKVAGMSLQLIGCQYDQP
jgi:cell division septation protein DedD